MFLFPAILSAVDDVLVLGLFRDKVVLLIDGKRRVLSIGGRSPEGVVLVSANSSQAVLEIQGRRSIYKLGSRVSTSFAKAVSKRITIYRDPKGTYTTVGSINGFPVNFLVDTGASAIAMSAQEAQRLGISYKLEGRKTRIQTASGTALAYVVRLVTVKIGDIQQRNVQAFVIEGEAPSTVLLGMSYLNRFNILNKGSVMHLEQKY
ncbi:MAG: TIGR02281 family clan AA aspartic protease [Gammaproteobacteria bacterium]|nr:TIGR02281 family clan AA aspartic protease [Gammaproteobacteria bacterium]